MAGFKAHLTGSTLLGIGYGLAGYSYGVPWPTCTVAGLACSVSGMLPDLDSDSGVPVRELLGFLAAVVPALMIPRFLQLGFHHEQLVLAVVGLYVCIRFVLGAAFRRYTVHRGMWHSLPAAAIAGLLAFEIVSGYSLEIRLYKAAAVVLGFVTHLVMDELSSVDVRRGIPRLKTSAGSALKLWTTNGLWPNVSTYAKLAALALLAVGDPYLMQRLGVEQGDLPRSPREWIARSVEQGKQVFEGLLRRSHVRTAGPGALSDGFGPPAPTGDPDPRWPWFGNAADGPVPPLGEYGVQLAPESDPASPSAESARRPFYYPATESRDRR